VKHEMVVRSAVIDWPDETLTITDTAGNKRTVPLDKPLHVVMVGYPDREEKDLLAHELGAYMSRGYIIEKITFEEDK
jgi:hypothetical protein